MMTRFRLTVLPILVVSTLLLPHAVWAQPPECPAYSRTFTRSGGTLAQNATESMMVDLKPCETVVISFTTTTLDQYGASAEGALHNAAGTRFFARGWTVPRNGGAAMTLPEVNGNGFPGYKHPFVGVSGSAGNLATVVLKTTLSTLNSWSMTAVTTPRPGYNLGGLGFDDATVIQPQVDMYGALHPFEGNSMNLGGQYFKIRLQPNQRVFMSGFTEGASYYGASLAIALQPDARLHQGHGEHQRHRSHELPESLAEVHLHAHRCDRG